MRLRDAHVQLSRALNEAQAKAAERSAERVEARIREESARQLVDRARAALEDIYDRRMAALATRRRATEQGE
jgi:CHASE3 domain sensor protein